MSEFDYSGLPGQEQADLFREVAISRHPGAAAFRDLLTGPDLESVISLAKDVEQRMSKTAPTSTHRAEPTSTGNSGQQSPLPPLPNDGAATIAGTDHPTSAAIKERIARGEYGYSTDDARRDLIRARLMEAGGSA